MGLFCLKDYKEAARIRDSLRSFEEEEPVLRLRRLLKQAIAEERFEVPLFLILLFSTFLPLHFILGGWSVLINGERIGVLG